MRELILGGLVIPREAGLRLTQEYDTEDAVHEVRMNGGELRRQQTWGNKIRTTIRGSNGLIPVGLDGLDFTQPLLLSCIRVKAVTSPAFNIAITPNRRSDAGSTPLGFARIGRTWQRTDLSMNGDIAELAQVPGASLYQVKYWPEFLCFATRPRETGDVGLGFDWSFTAREI